MKQVYKVKIIESNEGFIVGYHDKLVAVVLDVDETDVRVIENVKIVNGEEVSRKKYQQTMVNGEYICLQDKHRSGEIFESLDDLKQHINDNYELVKTREDGFLFLDKKMYKKIFAITNSDRFCFCPRGYVNLQKLLGLKHVDSKAHVIGVNE